MSKWGVQNHWNSIGNTIILAPGRQSTKSWGNLPRNNLYAFLYSDKTIKLWKVSERDKRAEGYNLKEDTGLLKDPSTVNTLRVSIQL